jgi:hypothetical protein
MEKWWEHHFFFELSEINLNDITVTNSVQSVIASGLGRAVANGNVDPESVERMIAQANADLAQGKSYSPALVALFAIAMADRQAFDGEERQNNWVGWEDDNIVPIIYFGEDGAFTSYGQVPGGGNL